LETYATRHASALLGVLAKRMPKTAHLSKDHNMPDLSVDPIVAGDVLVVQPDRDGAPALTSIDGRAESLPPRSST
jgi:cation transport ATPase